jgi:rare lipoprotein A
VRTASGAKFIPGGLTAAHRSLPFGTRLRVTNLANQRSVLVTVNDRGPFTGGRLIDLSAGAADVIGMRQAGVAQVRIERLAALAQDAPQP